MVPPNMIGGATVPLDVVALTRELSAIPSVSAESNLAVADRLEAELRRHAFTIERLEYTDAHGTRKANLVARKGQGTGGLAFLSHLDTVPGGGWDRDPWSPIIEGDHLIGLGVCDMKGPLVATLAAAAFDTARLAAPITIVATADEEISCQGARHVVDESVLLRETAPRYGVVAEPTRLVPVYAHKGGASVRVVAEGVAAHTSLDRGISANFLIAPFLAEMAALAERLKRDTSYQNPLFDPPTLGFNLTLDDGGCKPNVTAARTVATLGMRPMPDDRSADVLAEIVAGAERYGFAATTSNFPPFSVSPESEVVRAALAATGEAAARVVPYGTEAFIYQERMEVVILGPGDIAQAHTNGEWIALDQLARAVEVYTRMIAALCR